MLLNPNITHFDAILASSNINFLLTSIMQGIFLFEFNQSIFPWIESIRNDFLNYLFYFFTLLGNEIGYLVLAGILLWGWNYRKGFKIFIYLLISVISNNFLKTLFSSPRPPEEYWIMDSPEGYGFPSGHAQNSVVFFGYLASKEVASKLLRGIFAFSIIMISLSRIYLGVHYVEDVLGGLLFGTLLLLLVLFLEKNNWFGFTEKFQQLSLTKKLLSIVMPVLIIIIVTYLMPIPDDSKLSIVKIAGIIGGGISGYILIIDLSPRIVEWQQDVSIRIARTISGVLMLAIVHFGLSTLFKTVGVDFYLAWFRYALVGLFAMSGIPVIFSKTRLD